MSAEADSLRSQIAALQAQLAAIEGDMRGAVEPRPIGYGALSFLRRPLAADYLTQPGKLEQRHGRKRPAPLAFLKPAPPPAPPARPAAYTLDDAAKELNIEPAWLASVVKAESGNNLKAVNPVSGASGLIQWLPSTAKELGTSVEAIRQMTREQQNALIVRYLKPYAGHIRNEGDAHLAVFYPKAIGQPDTFELFRKGTKAYEQNQQLDRDNKGFITRADVLARYKKDV